MVGTKIGEILDEWSTQEETLLSPTISTVANDRKAHLAKEHNATPMWKSIEALLQLAKDTLAEVWRDESLPR